MKPPLVPGLALLTGRLALGGSSEDLFGGCSLSMALYHGNETFHAFQEMRAVQEEFAVLAAGLPKKFWLVGRGKILFRMMESGKAVASAVDDHHRNVDAGQPRAGVVFNSRNQADRQPWKK